jgi:tetratricopeptide (TPR) repeat protein
MIQGGYLMNNHAKQTARPLSCRNIWPALLMGAAVLIASGPVRAQEDEEILRGVTDEHVEVEPASDADLDEILGQMDPEELEALVENAIRNSLQVEREQVMAEIEQNILYEMDDIDEALAVLEEAPEQPSQQDNIQRILKAYAIVDPIFARAHQLHAEGNYKAAAERLRRMLNPEDASYLSAAMHYLYADSLHKQDKNWPAVEAYSELLVNLPDRMSFGSMASQAAAEIYESMGRRYYAMEMYVYCLNNYSLTLSTERLQEMTDKVEYIAGLYKDPMGSVTRMMGEVQEELEKPELGETTQDKQEEVIALLEDLIKNLEDKNRPDPKQKKKNQSGEGRNRQQRQTAGQQQGDAASQGQKQQPVTRGGKPTNPMPDSVLVPGPVEQPNKLARRQLKDEAGKWSSLPPRKREQLRQFLRHSQSDRRGEQVREYSERLAEGE